MRASRSCKWFTRLKFFIERSSVPVPSHLPLINRQKPVRDRQRQDGHRAGVQTAGFFGGVAWWPTAVPYLGRQQVRLRYLPYRRPRRAAHLKRRLRRVVEVVI